MSAPSLQQRALAVLPWALGLWVVGVQVHELLATIGAWATALSAVLVARGSTPATSTGRTPWAAWGLFIAWSLFAPLAGGHLPTGTGLARLSDFVLIPAAAVAVTRLPGPALRRIVTAGGVALLVSVFAAALQHFGAWPSLDFFASLGWTKLGFGRVYELAPNETNRFMAGGLLLHRLKFANVTAVMAVLFAGVAVLRVPGWPKAAALSFIALASVTVFSYARAASVAALVGVAVVWWAGSKHKLRAVVGIGGLAALAALVVWLVPSLHARFANSLSNEGSGERTSLTKAGLNAVSSSPLVGIGLDRFRPGNFLPPDAPAQAREHPGKAHNQLVTIAAEAGVPAAVLLLIALGGWLAAGFRRLPQGSLLVGSVSIFMMLCGLHDPLFHAEGSLALMLGLGIGVGAWQRAGQLATPPTSPPPS